MQVKRIYTMRAAEDKVLSHILGGSQLLQKWAIIAHVHNAGEPVNYLELSHNYEQYGYASYASMRTACTRITFQDGVVADLINKTLTWVGN